MIKSLHRILLIALGLSIGLLPFNSAHSAQLVIIIDDIGNNYAQGNAMVELDGPLTLAFLPHTPYASRLANKAYQLHKEIILHAPMENTVKAALGPGALTQDLTEAEFKQTLKKAISSIPHIQGINNHMGSALTQNTQAMSWVMQTLKQQQLYFIDSLTSPNSVAFQQAKQLGLPSLKRHVFLDNELTDSYISKQFQSLIRHAKSQKTAIAIAHPHPETIKALTRLIPTLAKNNIESFSEFMSLQIDGLSLEEIQEKKNIKI